MHRRLWEILMKLNPVRHLQAVAIAAALLLLMAGAAFAAGGTVSQSTATSSPTAGARATQTAKVGANESSEPTLKAGATDEPEVTASSSPTAGDQNRDDAGASPDVDKSSNDGDTDKPGQPDTNDHSSGASAAPSNHPELDGSEHKVNGPGSTAQPTMR
jgi:hypothetical protein